MIPQAFTTRDMSEAYKWLQSLPPSVREEMKSMEQVVSLYLRAKRLGGNLPTPEELSIAARADVPKPPKDFQNTLKGLKHELEQFEFDQPLTAQPPTPQAPPQQPAPQQTSTATSKAVDGSLNLDARSRQIVNEVREGLNLSSDMEVVRMSLVIAYRTVKELLK